MFVDTKFLLTGMAFFNFQSHGWLDCKFERWYSRIIVKCYLIVILHFTQYFLGCQDVLDQTKFYMITEIYVQKWCLQILSKIHMLFKNIIAHLNKTKTRSCSLKSSVIRISAVCDIRTYLSQALTISFSYSQHSGSN